MDNQLRYKLKRINIPEEWFFCNPFKSYSEKVILGLSSKTGVIFFFDKPFKKKHFIILTLSDINKKRSFTIATTHLIASPELNDLKLLQIYCILKKLDKYNNIILAGDFNSKPDSDVYKLITSKPLKNKLGTFKTKNKYKITHKPNLITTHTKNLNSDVFTATIDYIVVQDNIVVEKTSKLYDISKYNEKNLAPNISESSDHFMISAYVHL